MHSMFSDTGTNFSAWNKLGISNLILTIHNGEKTKLFLNSSKNEIGIYI